MEPGIEAAKDYIESLFRGNADGHDAAHSLRVFQNAMMIAQDCPEADAEIVALAALLHDADDDKLFDTEHNANARAFLTGQGVAPGRIDQICECINTVSFRKNRDRTPGTLEGQIVQDADRLDALGAVGVARTFAFGGKHGRSLESSVDHFHEKLLLLKDMMHTRRGRALAEERHAFLEQFLRELERELNGSDSSPTQDGACPTGERRDKPER